MYYFFRFGYDGSCFTGFQRGNGNNSVEDSILSSIHKHSISHNIQCAARTDRNVSATGNVFRIQSDQDPGKIAGILNSECPGIFVSAYATVTEDANPRHCVRKRYIYFLDPSEVEYDLIADQIRLFQGTHDFSMFCRKDSRNPIRTIDSIELHISSEPDYLEISFTARSFVWMQIRNIVGFTLESAYMGEIRDPFNTPYWSRKPASPYPLLLETIEYPDLKFTAIRNRAISMHYKREYRDQWAKSRILYSIGSFLDPSPKYSGTSSEAE